MYLTDARSSLAGKYGCDQIAAMVQLHRIKKGVTLTEAVSLEMTPLSGNDCSLAPLKIKALQLDPKKVHLRHRSGLGWSAIPHVLCDGATGGPGHYPFPHMITF